jgi:peptidoglycan pentaglycine glycine transferase (the first glycine)
MAIVNMEEWNHFLSIQPDMHFKQSTAWGEVKSSFGWCPPIYITSGTAGAQILLPKLPLGLKVAYIPGGPVGYDFKPLWKEIDQFCKQQHIVFLKAEPHAYEPLGEEIKSDFVNYFQPSRHTMQVRRSIIVNLDGDEAAWLSRMNKNARQKIKRGENRGVQIVRSNNIEAFIQLMNQTTERHQLDNRDVSYHQKLFEVFIQNQTATSPIKSELFLAQHDDIPLSIMLVVASPKRAWCLTGGSSLESRPFTPTYPLILRIMHWAADHGCQDLDLWGIPDYDEETLETIAPTRTDGLWGAYNFKRNFGGKVVRSIGAWDRIYNPIFYFAYQSLNFIKTRYPKLYQFSVDSIKNR